jgi:hypothetical protein
VFRFATADPSQLLEDLLVLDSGSFGQVGQPDTLHRL